MSNSINRYRLRISDNICLTAEAANTFDNHTFFSVDRDRHGQYVIESKDGYSIPFPAFAITFIRKETTWWEVLNVHYKERKKRLTYDLIRCRPCMEAWLEDMFKKIG